jgi:hypothetical protein
MDRAAASGKMIDFALQFIDAGLYSSVCIVHPFSLPFYSSYKEPTPVLNLTWHQADH